MFNAIETGGMDWNGGHTFSQAAVDFGFHEYIEKDVARENPQLSVHGVYVEAKRILALRLAQDRFFDEKETAREEEMVTKWEVAQIDGRKQLVTRYGDRMVSLEELWRHTEEFAVKVGKPEAFNRAEMKTQLAIQDALVTKEVKSVVFILSHPESVRYAQKWHRGEDGAFYSTQIDIGREAGGDLRHDEVKGFLDRFRQEHRDTVVDVNGAIAGSYVALTGSMDTRSIRAVARQNRIALDVAFPAPRPDFFRRKTDQRSRDGQEHAWQSERRAMDRVAWRTSAHKDPVNPNYA